jgi:CheY-like chemotaxis protein
MGDGPMNSMDHGKASLQPPPKTIVLVDDDVGVRESLGRVLESEYYRVVFARNGREAATRFLTQPPDLVLLDFNMPKWDGWVAFRILKVTQPLLPVIIITAHPDQYEKAVTLGANALMEKPLDLPQLLTTIQNLLRSAGEKVVGPGVESSFSRSHFSTAKTPMTRRAAL